jgi:hypothetical protein
MSNTSKSAQVKRILIMAISIIVTLGALSFVLFEVTLNNSENKTIATVNNDPIYVDEFREKLLIQRIPVEQYFREKYGVAVNGDFWESSYDGGNPLKKAKEMALNEYVKIKVEQELGRDKGLVEDISYPAFLKQLEQENKRRKKAVENNEVIYGPIEFQKNVYYEYLRSNLEIKLKEVLESKEIQFTEEDLMKYYEQAKDSIYRKEGEVKITKIYITYMDESGNVIDGKREEVLRKIKEVKLKMDEGERIENIPSMTKNVEALKVSYKEQAFNETTAKQDAQTSSELKSQARRLSLGEISDIYEEYNTFYFIKCIEKESDGYKPFEEAKENVKVKFIDKKYEELIDKLVKDAKVEINEDIYERMKMQ